MKARDRARVLGAAEDEFFFTLALSLLIDAGQGGSQADQQDCGCHHDKEQCEAGSGVSQVIPVLQAITAKLAPPENEGAEFQPATRTLPVVRHMDSRFRRNDLAAG